MFFWLPLALSPTPPPPVDPGPVVWPVAGPQLTCPVDFAGEVCFLNVRVPLDGGPPEITFNGAIAGPVAFAGGRPWWTSSITFASLSGGFGDDRTAPRLDWPGGRIRDLAGSNTHLWVATETQILALPLDGGPHVVVAQETGAYFIDDCGAGGVWSHDQTHTSGAIFQSPLAGPPLRAAFGDDHPQGVACDAEGVYWTNFRQDDREDGWRRSGSVGMKTAAGTQILATDQPNPQAIAVAGAWVYWVGAAETGRVVRRVRKTGGAVEDLAASAGHAFRRRNRERLRIYDGQVYWNAGYAVMVAPVEGGAPKAWVVVPADGDVVDFALGGGALWVTAAVLNRGPNAPFRTAPPTDLP